MPPSTDLLLRRAAAGPLLGLAALVLAACGGPGDGDTAATDESSPDMHQATHNALIDRALEIEAPTTEQRPVEIEQLGFTRTDPYAWLRDDNWQEVMRDPSALREDIRAHLEAENAYYNQVMAPTEALQARLYEEMRGRIKEDDSSVPMRDGPWFYYTRYREGGQYPVFARRPADGNGEISGEEQIVLDGDAMAEGFEYFEIETVDHSPDHRYLAYAVDTTGSEFYALKIRDLETGEDIATLTEEAAVSALGGLPRFSGSAFGFAAPLGLPRRFGAGSALLAATGSGSAGSD